jgi:carbamoyl-phosphate synthase large subunit
MKKNILVFPCGSGIGQEIYNSLKDLKFYNIYGANYKLLNAGTFLYDNYLEMKTQMNENNFIAEFNELIFNYKIDYIFPAYDDAIVYLKTNENIINAKILTLSLETVNICRSKKLTYELLENIIPTPQIYNNTNIKFPLFIKPDKGSGSIDCFKINDIIALQNKIKDISEPLMLEYLPNDEYTIDCLSSYNNDLIYCNARKRNNYKNGIAIYTTNKIDNDLEKKMLLYAQQISSKLKMIGCWFFQIKLSRNNIPTLLEVAPRVAGSMVLSRLLGVNIPHLHIEIFENKTINIQKLNITVENYKIYKNYTKTDMIFNNIYCDLDDTLIINDDVNYELIAKLYKNKKKHKIFLLTKHNGNVLETLQKYNICIALFNDIIHIDKNLHKYTFMTHNDILIDDSFSERYKCYSNNILALDVSMIDLL